MGVSHGDLPAPTVFLDEPDTISKWYGLEASHLRSMKGPTGGLWRGADGTSGGSAVFNANFKDWRGYKGLRFWVYSEAATNAEIMLTLTSPGPNGQADYYFWSFRVNWRGWNSVIVPFSQLKTSRRPAGLHNITKIVFNSKGWWLSPKPNTQLTFDRIALSKGETFPDASSQAPAMTVYNSLNGFSPKGPAVPAFETKLGFKCIRFALPGHRYDIIKKRIGAEASATQIQKAEITAMAKDLAKYHPNCVVALDLEHWKLSGAKNPKETLEIKNNIRMLGVILDWMHAAAPSLLFGYYSLLPARDYWRALKGPNDAGYKAWQADNAALAPVAAKVNIIFPSLYTFYNDPKGWVSYAKANLAEARKYKRPIYPFLWPSYHDGSALKNTRIDGSFWKLQLETMRSQNVNGIVMWDWAMHTVTKQKLPWKPLDPWWTSTMGFLFP